MERSNVPGTAGIGTTPARPIEGGGRHDGVGIQDGGEQEHQGENYHISI